MPYRKPKIPFQKFVELIRGKGINAPRLAIILECCPNTARSKMKNPELFTLRDIKKIQHRGHIQKVDIWDAIQKDN